MKRILHVMSLVILLTEIIQVEALRRRRKEKKKKKKKKETNDVQPTKPTGIQNTLIGFGIPLEKDDDTGQYLTRVNEPEWAFFHLKKRDTDCTLWVSIKGKDIGEYTHYLSDHSTAAETSDLISRLNLIRLNIANPYKVTARLTWEEVRALAVWYFNFRSSSCSIDFWNRDDVAEIGLVSLIGAKIETIVTKHGKGAKFTFQRTGDEPYLVKREEFKRYKKYVGIVAKQDRLDPFFLDQLLKAWLVFVGDTESATVYFALEEINEMRDFIDYNVYPT